MFSFFTLVSYLLSSPLLLPQSSSFASSNFHVAQASLKITKKLRMTMNF